MPGINPPQTGYPHTTEKTMAQGDIWRVAVVQQLQDSEAQTVYHVSIDSSQALDDLQTGNLIGNTVENAYDVNMKSVLSHDWRLGCIQSSRVAPTTGPLVTYFPSALVEGQVAEDSCPPQAAALVSHYTAFPGRSGRGRSYIPGIPQSHVNSGTWIASFHAAFESAFGFFSIAMTGADLPLVVYSRTLAVGNVTTYSMLRNVLQTQRRRTAKCVGLATAEG